MSDSVDGSEGLAFLLDGEKKSLRVLLLGLLAIMELLLYVSSSLSTSYCISDVPVG